MANRGGGRAGLVRYVPRVAAEWDVTSPSRFRVLDATLCFVDISGFTKLSERLARRGRIGAEELTEVLNRIFGDMLDLAYARGGSLLKFGGDALLLLFEGDDHPLQAASAAVEMRQALRAAATIPTSVGRVALRMSVGIHSGPVHLFRVGARHHELVVTGPGASRVTQMEHAAAAGEILVSADTAGRLPTLATTRVASDVDAGRALRWRRAPVPPSGAVARRSVSDETIVSSLPATLRAHLCDGVNEFEHRVATVAFVRFTGVDALFAELGPDGVAVALDDIVSTAQRAAEDEGVAFLASDIDEDGGKLILAAGVPVNQTDDEGRLLRAARRIADHPTYVPPKIGVHRGHVFAGTVGTPYRATYTIMGDTVNLAARLMAAAPPGCVYTTAGVLERARSHFDVEPVPPFHVKGKSAPVHAVALGAETDTRHGTDDREEAPFTGRDAELSILRDTLAGALASNTHESVSAIVVEGDTGVGKSRLVREAITRAGLPAWTLRGEPTGSNAPYRVFRDPLRELLDIERAPDESMATALQDSVGAIEDALLPFVPLIADVLALEAPPTPEVAALDPEFRPQRLADTVIRLLDARLPPHCVIVLDDAQWTDAATDTLLERIIDAARTRRWRVVVVRRGDERGFNPSEATRVEVEVLSDDAVRTMVVDGLGTLALRPHEIETIVKRAAGNPLFATELVAVARARGGLEDVPESLEGVLNSEIDRLPPTLRALLRHSSVLGVRFRPALLRGVLADTDVPADDAAVAALGDFLRLEGDAAEFRHAVARDAAYAGLPYRRRRELHLRAGNTIERLAGDDVEREAADLSFHFATGGDHAKTWRYARLAGDSARSTYDNVDAAAHYRRALDAARRIDDANETDVLDTWTALGDVLEQAGVLDGALNAYRAALRTIRDDNLARAEVYLRLARVRLGAGSFTAALRDLSRAERLLDGEQTNATARTRVAVTISRARVRIEQERRHVALALATDAAVAAEALGDQAQLARALGLVNVAHMQLGEPERAVHLDRVIEIHESLGETGYVARALGDKGVAAYWLGRWTEALDCYRRAAEMFERVGDVINAALFQANIGEILINQGRYDLAGPSIAQACRTHRAVGFVEGVLFDEIQNGRLARARGERDLATQTLRAARDEATRLRMHTTAMEAAIYLAEVLTDEGETGEALAVLEAAEQAAGVDAAMLAPSAALARAEALSAAGRHADADTVATAGIDAARAMGDGYKFGQLLLVRGAARERLGLQSWSDDEGQALVLLEKMGVAADLRPAATLTSQ